MINVSKAPNLTQEVRRRLARPIHMTQNYRIQFGFRSIKLPGMTDEQANAYAKTLKLYPLAEAANPKPTRFVDAFPDRLSTLPFYDFRYFHDLYDIISVEPVRSRDKVMMGMLASIGLEPGKPFNPSPKAKAAMERAVIDAYFYMQDRFFKVQGNNPTSARPFATAESSFDASKSCPGTMPILARVASIGASPADRPLIKQKPGPKKRSEAGQEQAIFSFEPF
jgi:hypothetical protein